MAHLVEQSPIIETLITHPHVEKGAEVGKYRSLLGEP